MADALLTVETQIRKYLGWRVSPAPTNGTVHLYLFHMYNPDGTVFAACGRGAARLDPQTLIKKRYGRMVCSMCIRSALRHGRSYPKTLPHMPGYRSESAPRRYISRMKP